MVGTGHGDVEEVRVATRRIAAAGGQVRLVRSPDRPWPSAALDAGEWPGRRVRRIRRAAERALTVSAQFGVAAAPGRPGPFGRAGVWASTVAELEATYGRDRVLHLSLEEFARNLPAAKLEADRWREGGRTTREIAERRRSAGWPSAVRRMRRLVRRHRAFDRPNLLVLYPTFRASAAFRRDFPRALEIGPVWPEISPRSSARPVRADPAVARPPRWLWYASPSTAPLLVPGLAEGARAAGIRLGVEVRSDPPFGRATEWLRLRALPPEPSARWRRRFAAADLRIVTGSRTLLEAVRLGGPFLYFNGALGRGRSRRRHRPEKLDALLATWPRDPRTRALRRDLVDFARGVRVAEVVRAALTDPSWARAFPPGRRPPAEADGGAVVAGIARAWAGSRLGATAFARRTRGSLRGRRLARTLMAAVPLEALDAG